MERDEPEGAEACHPARSPSMSDRSAGVMTEDERRKLFRYLRAYFYVLSFQFTVLVGIWVGMVLG